MKYLSIKIKPIFKANIKSVIKSIFLIVLLKSCKLFKINVIANFFRKKLTLTQKNQTKL